MDEPVDNLVFSKKLRTPKGKITLFEEAAQFIILPPPPANSSLETGKDLLTAQGASFLRTDTIIQSIKKHDKDPVYAIKIYMDLFGLSYDITFITKVLKEASILIALQKNKFNRPRPHQVAAYFGIDLHTLGSKTNKTPSYPAGHAAQARLIAEIYGEIHPYHKENLLRAAEESGFGRVIAGFHYPSDHKRGVNLGKRLFKALKNKRKKKIISYNKVFDLKQRNRR